MQFILMPDQMRLLEKQAFSLGVPSLLLMENAARACHAAMRETLGGLSGKRVLFLIGGGNNGGDGLALARLCALDGAAVRAVLTADPATPDAKANLDYLKALGIPLLPFSSQTSENELLPRADIIVDAVFGTGFHGALPLQAARLFRAVTNWPATVFAIDTVSGMDCLTGETSPAGLKADHTLVLGHLKIGQCLGRNTENQGRLRVLDIGIPEGAYQLNALSNLITALEEKDLRDFLPKRRDSAHKGDNGRVLMYMGALGMAGAAAMAARAALAGLRAGAGLLTFACEEGIIPILQTLVPNATCVPIAEARRNPPRHDVFAVGCGLSQSEEIWQNILVLWQKDKLSVWDADALNLLAGHPMHLGEKAVLTPHPGEAGRLLGLSAADVAFDPLAAAFELQRRYGGTVVLKGALTLIKSDNHTAINRVGSSALAKGGSGDALAGIIAGLLAQHPTGAPFDAARTACLWHGMAGRLAEQKYGKLSPLTEDVIGLLGEAARISSADA